MSESDKILQNIQQEMKRGTLVLAALMLLDAPQYGYSLIQALNEKGIAMEQSTLYPLLRRLEKQALLKSFWQLEDNRPRRYYQISPEGVELRSALITEWSQLVGSMSEIVGGKHD